MPLAPPRLAVLSLALAGALAGCGDAATIEGAPPGCDIAPTRLTATGTTCPGAGTALRFTGGTPASFGSGFMNAYCTRCHSTTLSGNARQGAPVAANWDDVCSIRNHLQQIDGRVSGVDLPAMPIGDPQPPQDQKLLLYEWLSCGAP